MRQRFLSDSSVDQGEDSGTRAAGNTRTISQVAKRALGPKHKLELLYRIIRLQEPRSILELGTCLGVSAAYLAEGANAKVTTVEGNSYLSELAANELRQHGYNNVDCINSRFDDIISRESDKLHLPWFIYLDGNHHYDATLKYFNIFIERARQDCILVLDDIYWSKGMAKAWKEIVSDRRVPISIDLFHLGVLIFRFNQPKQHFRLRA